MRVTASVARLARGMEAMEARWSVDHLQGMVFRLMPPCRLVQCGRTHEWCGPTSLISIRRDRSVSGHVSTLLQSFFERRPWINDRQRMKKGYYRRCSP